MMTENMNAHFDLMYILLLDLSAVNLLLPLFIPDWSQVDTALPENQEKWFESH